VSTALTEARRSAVASALRAEALQARVEAMSRQLTDVHTRLAAVENALLEATWESAALEPPAINETAAIEPEERIAVPKFEIDTGGMSRTAAQALFGH